MSLLKVYASCVCYKAWRTPPLSLPLVNCVPVGGDLAVPCIGKNILLRKIFKKQ